MESIWLTILRPLKWGLLAVALEADDPVPRSFCWLLVWHFIESLLVSSDYCWEVLVTLCEMMLFVVGGLCC